MIRSIQVERARTSDLVTATVLGTLALFMLWMIFSGRINSAENSAIPLVRLAGNHPALAKCLLGLACLIFLLGTLAMIGKYRDKTPAFSADANGIVDAHYDPAEAIGPISWSEIKGFSVRGKFGKNALVVELKHPHDYLAVGNENRRRNSARFMDEFGSPVVIGSSSLKIEIGKLYAACIKMHSMYADQSNR